VRSEMQRSRASCWTQELLDQAALEEATWIHISDQLRVPATPLLFMWVEKLLLEEREGRLSGA
jgi:hypothetical protein